MSPVICWGTAGKLTLSQHDGQYADFILFSVAENTAKKSFIPFIFIFSL